MDHISIEDSPLLRTIGNTPLIELKQLVEPAADLHVYAKLELLNPGGSAKDRPALRMLRHAWNQGFIGPGSVIIESSSGNMAISLAYICKHLGMRFISVIDPRTTTSNIRTMKAYGAEISYVDEPDQQTGEFLQARLHRVRQLLHEIPGSYWPNQYANEHNYRSHAESTMPEIIATLKQVDYLFGAVSTCGTLLGCSTYVRDNQLPTKIIAVDAEGSVLFNGQKGPRRFPGIGAGIVPPFAEQNFFDAIERVSDIDMVRGCRLLVEKESILAGASSGGVISATLRMAPQLPAGSVCVVLVHDRGERYLDTVYNDEWMEEQFGPAWALKAESSHQPLEDC